MCSSDLTKGNLNSKEDNLCSTHISRFLCKYYFEVNYLVIKLGISIFSVPNQDVNVLLDFIIDNGFEALELWDEDSSHNTVNSEKQEYIKNSGLSVSIHAPLLNLGSTSEFEKNIHALKKTIQKAYNYNAKRIVLHTGDRKSVV